MKVVFPTAADLQDKDDYQTTHTLNDLPREKCSIENLLPVAHDIKISEKLFAKIHTEVVAEHPELQFTRFAGGAHMEGNDEDPVV